MFLLIYLNMLSGLIISQHIHVNKYKMYFLFVLLILEYILLLLLFLIYHCAIHKSVLKVIYFVYCIFWLYIFLYYTVCILWTAKEKYNCIIKNMFLYCVCDNKHFEFTSVKQDPQSDSDMRNQNHSYYRVCSEVEPS